ncbi:MAG: ribosome biogenesis GTPase YqeH [Thermotogae bacterium]|nr:MAG: ribosome biogenesis GTPase YqeH [Thermotogota bacterium]
MRKCNGCGARLQTDDPSKPGYIPSDVLAKRRKKAIVCQRCFRLRHYGEDLNVGPLRDAISRVRKVLKRYEKVLWVVDAIDFEATYIEKISKFLDGKGVLVAVNKMDAFPKAVTRQELEGWFSRHLKHEYVLVSAERKTGMKRLIHHPLLRGEVLVIGCTNVGKSSLLSSLGNARLSVSSYPGTTRGVLHVQVSKNLKLVDTPGIPTHNRLIDLLDPSCVMKLDMSRSLTRKTFKIPVERVVFLGGMCRIDVLGEHPRPIFQIFTAPGVTLHETSVANANGRYSNWFGAFLKPPCGKLKPESFKWRSEEITLEEGEELAIFGLGWLSVRRGPLRIKVTLPKNVGLAIREALINPQRVYESR